MIKKTIYSFILLILFTTIFFFYRENKSNLKLIQNYRQKDELICPQVDNFFNLIGNSRNFQKLKLLPIDTRLDFHSPSSLAINTYEFTSVFTKKVEKSVRIFGLKEFGFYSNSYLPMIYDVEGDQNSSTVPFTPVLPNDFNFQFFFSPNIAIGIDNQWFVLSQSICDYGSPCKQILYKVDSNGKREIVKIPEKYTRRVIDTIDGSYKQSVVFKLSDNMYATYDTIKDVWQDFPTNIKYSKLNSVENIIKKYGCIYIPAYQGDVVFYKHNLFNKGYPDFKYVDIFYNKN